MMGKERNRCPDAHSFGALGDGGSHDLRSRTDVAPEVVFPDPHRVEAEFFGVSNFLKEVLVILFFRFVLGVMIKEREQAKFHSGVPSGGCSSSARGRVVLLLWLT